MMNLHELSISNEIGSAFGVALNLSISSAAIDIDRLTSNERHRFAELGTTRRMAWLKGRLALKQLLNNLGEDEDTAPITFPSSRFSLTHSGDFAIALGTDSESLAGIGVDFECQRPVRSETGRFFLTESEQSWAMSLERPSVSSCLLRLWTIKEALFKSDPRNLERWFSDYALNEPAEPTGCASVRGEEHLEFRYASLELEEGFLSMAVLPRRLNGA